MIKDDKPGYNELFCDNCGKMFFSFGLWDLKYQGIDNNFDGWIYQARNKGHIISERLFDDTDDTYDFCTKRCFEEYKKKYGNEPGGSFYQEFADDVENNFDDENIDDDEF